MVLLDYDDVGYWRWRGWGVIYTLSLILLIICWALLFSGVGWLHHFLFTFERMDFRNDLSLLSFEDLWCCATMMMLVTDDGGGWGVIYTLRAGDPRCHGECHRHRPWLDQMSWWPLADGWWHVCDDTSHLLRCVHHHQGSSQYLHQGSLSLIYTK